MWLRQKDKWDPTLVLDEEVLFVKERLESMGKSYDEVSEGRGCEPGHQVVIYNQYFSRKLAPSLFLELLCN